MEHNLSITIDVEDWYHIPSVTGSPFSVYKDTNDFFDKWNTRYDYLSKPTYRLLDILNEYDVKGTFFVVADIIPRYPGLVESIVEQGHEIACHGLNHKCHLDPKTMDPLIDKIEFEKIIHKAKNELENISKEQIIGYRAPNALFSEWMYDSLINLGFLYDSSVSINSFIKKNNITSRNINTNPVQLEEGPTPFIEFPFSHWDVLGIKIPTSGGPYLRFLGSSIILKGLLQSLKKGHTIFYIHPIDISYESFPKIGKGRPFYWLVKGRIIERRFRHILDRIIGKGISIKPIKDIALSILNYSRGNLFDI